MEESFHSGVVTWSSETGWSSTTAVKRVADDSWLLWVIVSLRLIRGHSELLSDWPARGWDDVSEMLDAIVKKLRSSRRYEGVRRVLF